LVRRLRAAGDTEGARDVARRRRPTRAAHAVNLLARRDGPRLDEYLDLGTRLRNAQVAAARDEDARDDLRTLDRDRRAKLADLLGRVESDRDDVERTLAVALTDEEVAATVRAGRLERIPDPASDFASFGDALADLQPPASRAETAAQKRRRDRLEELAGEAADIDATVAAAEADVREARAALATAERHLRDAERRRERVTNERDRLDRAN
jgi:hypothetical protein